MPNSDRAGTGAAREIVVWLVQELRFSQEPVKRDALAVRLREHVLWNLGIRWSSVTACRRLREAIRAATDAGWPIVSEGEGFFLARTAAQRKAAADRLRATADDLVRRAAALDVAPVSGEQARLFGEAS